MTDLNKYSEAAQEAMASVTSDDVILECLELRHPSFINTAVRIVSDNGDYYEIDGLETFGHYLTLESDAPIQAGQTVFYQSCMFSNSLPEQKEGRLPNIKIEIDNVTRDIVKHLDEAIGQQAPIEVSYRMYLASDKTTPQFIMHGMELREVASNLNRVTATAEFSDLTNKTFPSKVYRPDEFRGLKQR